MTPEEARHRREVVQSALASIEHRRRMAERELQEKLAALEAETAKVLNQPPGLRRAMWHADAVLPAIPVAGGEPYVLDHRTRHLALIRPRGAIAGFIFGVSGYSVFCDRSRDTSDVPTPEISLDTMRAILRFDTFPPIGEAPAPEDWPEEDVPPREVVSYGEHDVAGGCMYWSDPVTRKFVARIEYSEHGAYPQMWGPQGWYPVDPERETAEDALAAVHAWLAERGYAVQGRP